MLDQHSADLSVLHAKFKLVISLETAKTPGVPCHSATIAVIE
jgi:hypothetical protein